MTDDCVEQWARLRDRLIAGGGEERGGVCYGKDEVSS